MKIHNSATCWDSECREAFTLTAFSELRDTLAQQPSATAWHNAQKLSEKITNALDTGELLDALRDAASTSNTHELITEIRSVLAEPGAQYTDANATKVIFKTFEYDNGFFLNDTGVVHYADGEAEEVEFGNMVNELLTDEYGTVGRSATLTVYLQDPYTGDTEFEE